MNQEKCDISKQGQSGQTEAPPQVPGEQPQPINFPVISVSEKTKFWTSHIRTQEESTKNVLSHQGPSNSLTPAMGEKPQCSSSTNATVRFACTCTSSTSETPNSSAQSVDSPAEEKSSTVVSSSTEEKEPTVDQPQNIVSPGEEKSSIVEQPQNVVSPGEEKSPIIEQQPDHSEKIKDLPTKNDMEVKREDSNKNVVFPMDRQEEFGSRVKPGISDSQGKLTNARPAEEQWATQPMPEDIEIPGLQVLKKPQSLAMAGKSCPVTEPDPARKFPKLKQTQKTRAQPSQGLVKSKPREPLQLKPPTTGTRSKITKTRYQPNK